MAENEPVSSPPRARPRRWIGLSSALLAAALLIAIGVWYANPEIVQRFIGRSPATDAPEKAPPGHDDEHDHDHEGHGHEGHSHDHDNDDHEHEAHGDVIELSPQARANIGLKLAPVAVTDFQRTISVPGTVVERPGLSRFEVTAPLSGTVTKIYRIEGEAMKPGDPLFDVRLTHEDVVQLQADLLKTAEELDVLEREVARLDKVTRGGAIAGKTLLERQYEQQKQQAALKSQTQALRLHGFSAEQIDGILRERELLHTMTVRTPNEKGGEQTFLQLHELEVDQGQHVETGQTLAELVDHSELQIQGNAFERDIPLISRAASEDWKVTAVAEQSGEDVLQAEGLEILYLANKVDTESRMFHFYVSLPNVILREAEQNGRRFMYWQFKPGQRMQLRIPVEKWSDRIVLPLTAIAREGAEAFVFVEEGKALERRPAYIEYQDDQSAVIANDGSIRPGEVVAMTGAYQLQQAIKSKTAGGVDPHAGHSH